MTIDEKITAVEFQYPNGNFRHLIEMIKLKNAKMNIMELITGIFNKTGPSVYILRTGYSCNFNCRHCFADDKKITPDFSFDEVKGLIDEIGTTKDLVVLTGGEPTVRPDILEILKYLKTKNGGYLVDIQSNGFKFSDKAFLDKLEPYFDSIFLPFHSLDMGIFDTITQVPGSGEKVVQAFKNLAASSLRVTTSTVINRFNYKTIVETMDFIQKIIPGCTMVLTHAHPVGAAASREVATRYDEIHDSVQKALKKYGYLLHTHYLPRCHLYPYHTIVTMADDWENGSMVRKGMDNINNEWKEVDYGEYRGARYIDEKTEPNWPSLNIEQSKIKSIRCKECRFDKECIGIWREHGFLYPDLTDLVPIKKD